MSVCSDSGGLAVTNAKEMMSMSALGPTIMRGQGGKCDFLTFCSEIFGAGHVVHGLQGLGLLTQKGLLVIILAGPAEAIKDNASRARAARCPKHEDDEGDENDGPERGDEADDDAGEGRGGGIADGHGVVVVVVRRGVEWY